MGDIIDLQSELNERNGVNLSYVKNKLKPPMSKKGIKGFASLIAPGANKRYKLDQNQRKVQLAGRTIVGIAALISSLTIGSAVVSGSISNTTVETQEMLQQNDLMEIAENRLLECVFGDKFDNIDNPNIVYNVESDGHRVLKVTSGRDDSKEVLFAYDSNLFSEKFTNAKEIVSLMNDTIDVHFSENASKKKLENLKESIEKSEDKDFKLKNGHIVEDKQIENDNER